MTEFEVHVVPRASQPGPDGRHDGVPRLRVKSPPTGGRANAEAEKCLSALLRSPVRLKRGGRSRRKIFEGDLPSAALERALRDTFGT